MIIESLELKNFRNYESLKLQFDPGTNIFHGDNAQGKTNILESMFVCGTTRSHKGSKDADMIRFEETEAHIRMMMCRDEVQHRVDMHLKKNKAKGVAIDGIPIRRSAELLGFVHMVFFSPEDLNIIKNGPGERRKFIDSELCQLNKVYLSELTSYQKILTQRNKLLKDLPFMPNLLSTLDVWDEQLVHYGKKVIEGRSKFIEILNKLVREIHYDLSDGKENLEIVYEPNASMVEFQQKLFKNRAVDEKLRTSNTGPHRDDIRVCVNGVDIRHYGSQGQQRSAALSMKLSEIYLVKDMIHDTPILLLDDVLSELDRNRQKKLLETIKNIQTFITCTGMDELVENNFPMNRVFHVVQGTVD